MEIELPTNCIDPLTFIFGIAIAGLIGGQIGAFVNYMLTKRRRRRYENRQR